MRRGAVPAVGGLSFAVLAGFVIAAALVVYHIAFFVASTSSGEAAADGGSSARGTASAVPAAASVIDTPLPPPTPSVAAVVNRGEEAGDKKGGKGKLHAGKAKRRKAARTFGYCATREDCGSGQLCVDGECVCPMMYSGDEGCTQPNKGGLTPEPNGRNRTAYKGAWCVVPMDDPVAFPVKGDQREGPHGLRTYLFQALKGQHPDLPELADFSSCALVGSSASLLNKQLGYQIEKFSTVIRFNDAPTLGFEPFVGRKTTIRVQNIEYCGFRERDNEILLHYTDWRRAHYERCRDDNIKRVSPRMLSYSQNYFLRAHPNPNEVKDPSGGRCKLSAGFFGIALATHLCGKVALFGFDQTPGHYYVKGRKQAGNLVFEARHAWTYERRCINLLAKSKWAQVGRFTKVM